MFTRLKFAFAALLSLLLAMPTVAFTPPEGRVLLTISGVPDHAEPILFDRALLETLQSVTFSTTTIWTEGVQEFTGVPLSAFLDHLGVAEGTLRAIAANDYAIDIPVAGVGVDAPILAYLQNGAPMSLRNRGPIWLVYPYDSDPEYRTELIYSRSIWQLNRIELRR